MKTRAFIFLSFCFQVFASFGFGDYEEPPTQEEEINIADPNLVDLEESAQDFVLETKRIRFAQFPDAFNPSITRWKGQLSMCFRTYHPITRSTNQIGLVYLDENFDPAGEPRFLKFQAADPYCLFKRQDPRLFAIGDRLYAVYNNAINNEVRRMLVTEIVSDGENFIAQPAECFIHFEGETGLRSEKNWVPFVYQDHLNLAYSLVPHRILTPVFGTESCRTAFLTHPSVKWNWGVLRGGTPALLEGGEYLAFFHSSKSMATQHSKGKNIPHYFMGAYTFSAEPPFAITRISSRPIIGKKFYKGKSYKTWKPLHVVFPGGYISDENYLWILYGRQDHEIWVAKLDKNAFFNSLIPVLQ